MYTAIQSSGRMGKCVTPCHGTAHDEGIVYVRTLEGNMRADWTTVIKGVKGELHPCKPEFFNRDPLEE